MCMRFVCARELLLDRKRSLPRGLSAAYNVPRKHSRVLVLFLGFGGWAQSRQSLLLWVHAAAICPFLLNHALTGPSSWVILDSVLFMILNSASLASSPDAANDFWLSAVLSLILFCYYGSLKPVISSDNLILPVFFFEKGVTKTWWETHTHTHIKSQTKQKPHQTNKSPIGF